MRRPGVLVKPGGQQIRALLMLGVLQVYIYKVNFEVLDFRSFARTPAHNREGLVDVVSERRTAESPPVILMACSEECRGRLSHSYVKEPT